MPAFPGERAHRGFAVGAADRIVDDINAMLAAQPLECVLQVLIGIVHQLVGAVGAGESELGVGRGAGDDPRAHQLAELDRRNADAARSAKHRKRLAGLERGAVLERVIGRPIGDVEPGRACRIEIGRQRDELLDRRCHIFAGRPIADVAQDPVAGLDPGHAGPDPVDNARELAAGRERQRGLGLVSSSDDQRVVEIQPDRFDLHHALAGAGAGSRHVGQHEVVRTAEMRAQDGFHDRSSAWIEPALLLPRRRASGAIPSRRLSVGLWPGFSACRARPDAAPKRLYIAEFLSIP